MQTHNACVMQRNKQEMKQAPQFTTRHGRPHPLGATSTSHNSTNFAIYARESEDVTLLFWPSSSTSETPTEIKLDSKVNLTGQVWHVELSPDLKGSAYSYRVGQSDPRWKSNICLDPYALALDTPRGAESFNSRTRSTYNPRGIVASNVASSFDWQGVPKPKIPWSSTIIYEMHVRGFTYDDKGKGGTYSDIVSRIPYLKSLGITTIELLPVMEFNEEEWSAKHPNSGKHLCQYWGYSTVSFFVPMNRFSRNSKQAIGSIHEFQYMVRELHRVGIEVILDVVYNHTAEMGLDFVGPGFYGMKQLAPHTYYHLRDEGKTFINHSGCGNTLNCNNVIVQDLIIASLKYWCFELGVDGFRFDLASILARNSTDGEGMKCPPLIERISKDSGLRGCKLIAEPWDCGGLYLVGSFPHYGVFGEWNGKFRDTIRKFVRGDQGMVGEFATRVCGSQDLYGDGRKPYHSLNFITAHDGFTLKDLVTYNGKHNQANGENNNDGESHNLSWNCGVEGDTTDKQIVDLRERQIKNMFVALLISAGTPMINMGDEYGHSRYGNNNTWCQDNELSWFDWKEAECQRDNLLKFTSGLISTRKMFKSLQRDSFLNSTDVVWHGVHAYKPQWTSSYNFLAFTFKGDTDIYVAFNAGSEPQSVELPRDVRWGRIVDTNLGDRSFTHFGQENPLDGGSRYGMAPFSALVLRNLDGRASGPHDDVSSTSPTSSFEKLAVVDEEAF